MPEPIRRNVAHHDVDGLRDQPASESNAASEEQPTVDGRLSSMEAQLRPLRNMLSVQLQVLEEARPRIEVRVDTQPSLHRPGDESLRTQDQDAEAIAFSVMMLASESAQEDLKAIMRQVTEINEAKQRQREAITKMQEAQARQAAGLRDEYDERTDREGLKVDHARPPRYGQSIDSVSDLDSMLPVLMTAYGIGLEREANELRDDVDSLAELSAEQQLRMQMHMDRMSRMQSALANIMKKLADTTQGLIQNMK